MKKVMFIGPIGCGKTTLTQRLQGLALNYDKTQAVAFYPDMIDTPGEYMLHRQYYSALSVTAAEADVVALMQSVSDEEQLFAPGFGGIFNKPIIGIVSKSDEATSSAQIEQLQQRLREAGAQQLFCLSAVDETGIAQLLSYLKEEEDETLH
ncbi:EutP/PduV family microcompartment system protein [Brochothrix campestris]|uniref:Propanediol utilization protein PduV n=1 Tax=Brochothrix campestris FSL F6-1037 TaxID=1265861 RepID=W7CMU9_9LIST|nr:EutP/PduV family microcompartment system protein [Brochothrix campestris]EUJ36976.1 propanediol utilization protein PduV [Brochothrix campestris FSL F6-1037]